LSCADQKLDEYDVAQVYGEDTVGTFDQVCAAVCMRAGAFSRSSVLRPVVRSIVLTIRRLSLFSSRSDGMSW
jgi:hypothetical protein